MLPFKVAAKYARGPEKLVAKFDLQDDAKIYIRRKLEEDAGLRVSVTYLLYDMGELMESFEPGSAGSAGAEGSAGASSGGKIVVSGLHHCRHRRVHPACHRHHSGILLKISRMIRKSKY
jgi:hypothetical protein